MEEIILLQGLIHCLLMHLFKSEKMNINYYICAILISMMMLTGCEKFLENTPRASISDEKLFQDEAGFEQALNGVYSALAGQKLYGDNLSMGYLSALAKNYSITASSHRFFLTNTFNYENSSRVNDVWSESYKSIAALNNILSQIDSKKSIFTSDNYRLIKGEALALRAYLHFDLFRLFGKSYRTNPDALAIPYRTEFALAVKKANTGKEVVDMALADLTLSEELLTIDPVSKEDSYRRYRLNYYATIALKARIFNYIGQENDASKYANLVIEANKFPFVQEGDIITGNQARKDRLFTSELVFALRVKDIANWAEGATSSTNYFRQSVSGPLNYTLTTSESNYRDLFEGALYPNDIRYKYLFEVDDKSSSGGTEKYPSKYWQTWQQAAGEISRDRMDQTVPLIRVSEMYYILANSAPSVGEALGYLNIVRRNRGVDIDLLATNIDELQLLDEITKEYQKEFYAEGQTFFWYKQIGAENIKFYVPTVMPENYIFPIPVDELEYNPSY